jgi:L-aminopeptidase/D-esterase-like protein
VIDPSNGEILAGVRKPLTDEPAGTLAVMAGMIGKTALNLAANTVIGVVATNGRLTKEEANKVAQMAQDGIARTVRPAHTMFDGDTLFALATGEKKADVNLVGAYAAEAVTQAIVRGVQAAESAGGLPAWRDLKRENSEA